MDRTCKDCGTTKPDTEFYPYQGQPCKECVKLRVRLNRARKVDYYRAYDRQRFQSDPSRQAYAIRNCRRYRQENPEKYAAHTAVSNAVRDGRLKREPCLICKREDSHAHHEDYSKPLAVIWLCAEHHQQYHMIREQAEAITKEAA
jgi:hypothetical protein